MSKKIHLVVAVMAIFGLTATAAQAQEMTMSLGAPSLLKRVAIIQPVTMSCSGFDPSLVVWTESVNVSVQQAAGRQIAHGSALGGPSPLVGCDGTENTSRSINRGDRVSDRNIGQCNVAYIRYSPSDGQRLSRLD